MVTAAAHPAPLNTPPSKPSMGKHTINLARHFVFVQVQLIGIALVNKDMEYERVNKCISSIFLLMNGYIYVSSRRQGKEERRFLL